jgi:hypothetical protein
MQVIEDQNELESIVERESQHQQRSSIKSAADMISVKEHRMNDNVKSLVSYLGHDETSL